MTRKAPAKPIEQLFYTIDQVAEMLNLSPTTVRRMIDRNEIRAIKIGRSVRIPKKAMDELASGLADLLTTTS